MMNKGPCYVIFYEFGHNLNLLRVCMVQVESHDLVPSLLLAKCSVSFG